MLKPVLTCCLILLVTCFGSATAQFPYGNGSPGNGGITPLLRSNTPYLGNGGFAWTISQASGGTSGFLIVSSVPAQTTIGGYPLYVDLAAPSLPFLPFVTDGIGGAPGVGTASVSISLAGVTSPALVGLSFWSQAGLYDAMAPNGLAVTNGLETQFTMPPAIFAGRSVGGATDTHYWIDPLGGPAPFPSQGIANTNNVGGCVFLKGGLDLIVDSFVGIEHADLRGPTPVWTTLQTLSGVGTGWDNVQYDRDRNLVWTVGDNGTGSAEFIALDVEIGSPNFGSIAYQSTGLGAAQGLLGVWTLSPSGNLAAVPGLLGGSLSIWDMDPQSASFLTRIEFAPIPTSNASSFWANTNIAFTPDEAQVLIIQQGTAQTPSEIARYMVGLLTFIDHDPSTPQTDNLGQFANPPVALGAAPVSLHMARNQWFAVASGFNTGGWVTRLDLDPGNPFTYNVVQATGTSLTNAYRSMISPDGTLVAAACGTPFELKIFDAATMAFQTSFPLGTATSISDMTWR